MRPFPAVIAVAACLATPITLDAQTTVSQQTRIQLH